jgi:ribonuclease HI
MIEATQLVARETGCTPDQARTVVELLIEKGWTAPAVSRSQPLPGRPGPGSASQSEQPLTLNSASLLVAHTDGACSGNPGPGGWAVVFTQDGKVVGQFSGPEPGTTNNRMELTAIREAIRLAPGDVALEINTDSNNAIGWLSKGWKRNEAALAATCAEIDQLRAARASTTHCQISFRYVRSHNGDPLNELADRLATGEARKAGRLGTKLGSA